MKKEKILKILKGLLKFIAITLVVAVALFVIYCGLDYTFKDILPKLSRSVISNFIVFVAIIMIVSELKVKPVKMIEDAQQEVVESIESSENAKIDSENLLRVAEENLSNIGDEIDALFEKTENNAQLVGAKILEDANRIVSNVQTNTEKAIENNQLILKNELIKRASLASVEVARAHIINELNNNQGLHDKLIDESVEAIEGVELV